MDAKAVYAAKIVPLAEQAGEPKRQLILDECQAMIAYHEGDLERVATLFEKMLASGATPPVTKAVSHYFLGLVAITRDTPEAAAGHLEQAARLAPQTIVRHQALEAQQTLRTT